MSGALASIYKAGKTFNNFYTSGSGGLVGLSLVAPKLDYPRCNLERTVEASISDPIYRFLPMMMMTSVVSLARWSKALFLERFKVHDKPHPERYKHGHTPRNHVHHEITIKPEEPTNESYHRNFIELNFDVPSEYWPELMTWSYSNLERCWFIGRRAGDTFIEKYGHLFPDRDGDTANALPTTATHC